MFHETLIGLGCKIVELINFIF